MEGIECTLFFREIFKMSCRSVRERELQVMGEAVDLMEEKRKNGGHDVVVSNALERDKRMIDCGAFEYRTESKCHEMYGNK